MTPLLLPLLAFVAACARPAPPTDAAAVEPGLVGIRYLILPEGVVVTEVLPGMGAEAAGVVTGDLIVAVDGEPIGGDGEGTEARVDVRGRIVGPAGTAVRLAVRAPLSSEVREVGVVRGVTGPKTSPEAVPAEVVAARAALRDGAASAAADAMRAAIGAGMGGMSGAAAVGRELRATAQRRPAVAAEVARAILTTPGADDELLYLAGEALYANEAYGEAAAAFERLERARPADVAGAGVRGDLGGDPAGRRMWASSLWRLGRRDEAVALGRALARTWPETSLLGEIGMAPLDQGDAWRVPLPPLPALDATLLDGAGWSLADHAGDVILLTFWASWCGPCMAELPHLQALYEERGPDGFTVLGVSLDDPKDADAVERTARKLGLGFPVTHAPELRDRFDIGPIPALRLVGRDGAVHYASRGYSEAAMIRLRTQVDAALAGGGEGALLGHAWTPGLADLLGFVPIAGLSGVAVADEGALCGLRGAAPTVVPWAALSNGVGAPVEPDVTAAGAPADRLTWAGGPVAADAGGLVVRAWAADGGARWAVTTPSPVTDLAAQGDGVLVATEGGVYALGPDGGLRASWPTGADALRAGPEGVWGVGGGRRWLLAPGADGPADQGEAPDAASVAADGAVASRTAVDLVVGRFGPDGAPRFVAARPDGHVIGLDGEGNPAFTLTVEQPVRLGVRDLDGDGRDELLVAVEDRGLAAVALSMP